MTLPAFILGVALSTLIGAAFHFWRGGSLGRLLLYLVLGWVGFWIGHGTIPQTKSQRSTHYL